MIKKLRKMVPIVLYTGLKNNKKMKMDQPKIKNGKLILNISEIGTIIKKMDSVYNFMETEINTKGVGKMIKEMAKELSGYQKEKIN